MTMEQVLRDIRREQGMSALRNREQLVGLFKDFSKNQLRPQANALKVFLDCQGNTRILNLQNAAAQEQQVQFHRLVREMVEEYNMQEETVVEVCSTFWRVALETVPPTVGRNEQQDLLPPPLPAPSPVSHSAQGRPGEITAKVVSKDANLRKPWFREGAQKVQRQKRKTREPLLHTRTGVAIIILWVFSALITVCGCKVVAEETNSGDGIFYLSALLMIAEFYLGVQVPQKTIVSILCIAAVLIALPYVHSQLPDGYQFVTILMTIWAALTILMQILLIQEDRQYRKR